MVSVPNCTEQHNDNGPDERYPSNAREKVMSSGIWPTHKIHTHVDILYFAPL